MCSNIKSSYNPTYESTSKGIHIRMQNTFIPMTTRISFRPTVLAIVNTSKIDNLWQFKTFKSTFNSEDAVRSFHLWSRKCRDTQPINVLILDFSSYSKPIRIKPCCLYHMKLRTYYIPVWINQDKSSPHSIDDYFCGSEVDKTCVWNHNCVWGILRSLCQHHLT